MITVTIISKPEDFSKEYSIFINKEYYELATYLINN